MPKQKNFNISPSDPATRVKLSRPTQVVKEENKLLLTKPEEKEEVKRSDFTMSYAKLISKRTHINKEDINKYEGGETDLLVPEIQKSKTIESKK